MHDPTVSAGLVAGLLAYAGDRGADSHELAARAGLAAESLDDPDARVPLPRYLSLVRRAGIELDDAAIALHYGAEVAMADLSIVGLIMESSPTMADALSQLQRYGRLALEIDDGRIGPRFELERTGSRLMLTEVHPHRSDPELIEEAFARLVCGPKRFLTRNHVLSVRFVRSAPVDAAEYERVLGCPVHFGAPRNALELHPDVGSWQVAQHPGYVFGVLQHRGDSLLTQQLARYSYRSRLEEVLREHLHEGAVGADATAARMNSSRSTMFRRLRDEGTRFSDVVEEVRLSMAVAYLRSGDLSVNQVAYLVGFSDPAAFSRAFRRWTGETPGRFRRSQSPLAVSARP